MMNTPFEQAKLAFDKLCALYNLPKIPEDLAQFEAYYEHKGIDAPTQYMRRLHC
ncbi:hypothetical protein G7074_06035 [Pedobacter sp. HDW13]|uniref:hypothetical protein n=1 Tax=unclassified Pedobacter TaxID=2628915 RepID=UPI00131A3F69|nr:MULTISPECIES: hypothetical protein [unclassified Pedobacter]QIL38879.1 hypothetical protein G7074_06035 [Pedobacter sp. HDW13]